MKAYITKDGSILGTLSAGHFDANNRMQSLDINIP